jgi:hypothetical protein
MFDVLTKFAQAQPTFAQFSAKFEYEKQLHGFAKSPEAAAPLGGVSHALALFYRQSPFRIIPAHLGAHTNKLNHNKLK